MPKGNPLYEVHTSINLDAQTNAAAEKAAATQDRSKSDWMRAVLRKELRQLGLLPAAVPDKRSKRRAT